MTYRIETHVTSVLLVLHVCIGVIMSSPNDTIPACQTILRRPTLHNQFEMNGTPLQTTGIVVIIPKQMDTMCFIDTDEFVRQINFPDHDVVGIIGVNCMKQTRVIISNYNGSFLEHVILYVQIVNCNMSLSDWNALAEIADTRVFTLIKNPFIDEEHTTNTSHCDGFRNIVSFSYDNIPSQDYPNFEDIFKCLNEFPEMTEVVFKDLSWSTLPIEMETKFPNLQTLDIQNNNFSEPPKEFPWTNTSVRLPKNLSRVPNMDSHYSGSEALVIPNNEYRRIYNLNFNKIRTLNEYAFHGFLHMISLKGNRLEEIDQNTFQNVTGLQVIDLSYNSINTLPNQVFNGLSELRKLDLSHNKLTILQKHLFKDMTSVLYLHLTNNSIHTLEVGVFVTLEQLTVLHLEYNNLTFVNHESFPISSIKLSEIYLHHNPLILLPEFIFWIRGLTMADLHATPIQLNNFTGYVNNMQSHLVLDGIIDSASDTDITDLYQRANVLKKIDLRKCNISKFYIDKDATNRSKVLFKILFLHFKFILDDNPLHCSCNIAPMSKLIRDMVKNKTIGPTEYFFKDWICRSPIELIGKHLLQIAPEDTYCRYKTEHCPRECLCYRRDASNITIVDCRNKGLRRIHSNLPPGPLELWYNGNNISVVEFNIHFERVVILDISSSRLRYIAEESLDIMQNLQQLYLQSNLLAYIPKSILTMELTNVSLKPNPFNCDCKSKWMKKWIDEKRDVINDWNKITCNINNEAGSVIIEVPDDDFVCDDDSFNSIVHVVVPAVTCSFIVIVLLIFFIMIYAYRMECKFFLFVYFGIHPFDKDDEIGTETIDCVIVHSGNQTEWVMSQIVELLESEEYNFVVCDMARDFVVGFSFQENLTRLVQRSKRMIFCISNDWNPCSENFAVAWGIAQEKIKETKSHFGIIVTHGVATNQIQDKDLQRFMARGRYVDSTEKHFAKKVVYYMPSKSNEELPIKRDNLQSSNFENQQIANCFTNTNFDPTETNDDIIFDTNPKLNSALYHAFISYADEDIDYILTYLQPFMEKKGFSLCIPDRDFIPGASKEDNILTSINSSMRTIFIISSHHVQDEWSLFTFRTAYEKSLRDKSNHLIVIVRENVPLETMDKEMCHYMNRYISINVNDRWFEQKLCNGLPLLKIKEPLHTSAVVIDEIKMKEEYCIDNMQT